MRINVWDEAEKEVYIKLKIFRGMLLRFSRRISEMQQEKKNFVRWCKTQFLKKCLSV